MKEQIVTDGAPNADHILSQGIISGSNIYVSGQIHNRPDGSLVEGSVTDKLAQIMQNIGAILDSADANTANVVKVVVYVTDMSQMPELNEAYSAHFNQPYPVREAVCVSALPLGATIEVSVVAVKN